MKLKNGAKYREVQKSEATIVFGWSQL